MAFMRMNPAHSLALIGLLLGLTSCSRNPLSESNPTPMGNSPQMTPTEVVATVTRPAAEPIPETAPKVVPTPHPASGATEAAIRLFPDLGKKDTMFNRTFRDLYTERKLKNPESLTRPDWPIEVAQETGKLLSILPAGATSAGAVAQVEAKPLKWIEERKNQPSALERGAYDQRRVMVPRYYYTDPYGRFWIDPNGARHYY